MNPDPNRQRPRSSKKRRAVQTGAPGRAATGSPNRPTSERVRAGSTRGGRSTPPRGGIPGAWLAIGAVAVFAVGVLLASGSLKFGSGGGPAASTGPSSGITGSVTVVPQGSASPGGSTTSRGTNCPTSQPPAAPAGQSRVVTIETAKGQIAITLNADLSPIAVGNFAALAGCGFYDGVVFHRIVPNFVIQGGDPTGTGTGGPGYTIKDEPVTTTYSRGTVAMARSSGPNTVGSQFFIVLADEARTALGAPQYNNYQIIGTVTSGLETVDAIAAAAGGVEIPADPVVMTKVTIGDPLPAGSGQPSPSAASSAATSATPS